MAGLTEGRGPDPSDSFWTWRKLMYRFLDLLGPDQVQAIAALVKCLDDKNYSVVKECVDSLAFIGDETTIVYLQPLMTHPDEDVRSAALEAIRWLQ